MGLRGATIQYSPWAREALSREAGAAIGQRALTLGCHVNMVGRSATGPWTVRAWSTTQRVEHRGIDLEATVTEALDRFEAGADTHAAAWRAGSDGLAHGQIGRAVWTLCRRPALSETLAHPERVRCVDCLRALDSRASQAVSA